MVGLDLAGKKFPQAESRLEQLYRKDPYRALAGLVEAIKCRGRSIRPYPDSTWSWEIVQPRSHTPLLAETAIRASSMTLLSNQYQALQAMFPRSATTRNTPGHRLFKLQVTRAKAIASFERARNSRRGIRWWRPLWGRAGWGRPE